MEDQDPPAAPAQGPGTLGGEEALIQLATEIGGHATLAELLDNLTSHLRPLFPFDGVGIVLHDPATNEISLSMSFGHPGFEESSLRRPVFFGPAGWVFQSQQARYDVLTSENTHPTLTMLFKAGFRSASWLPLSTSRTRLGTFVVVRKTDEPISPESDRLMKWAASIVALAIEHVRQVEALERLQRQIADERDRARGALYDLGERVKELTALHETTRLLEDEQLGVEGLLDQLARLLPPAFQFPEIASASVTYGATVVRTPGFADTPWIMSSAFTTRDGVRGGLNVAYREARAEAFEGPFLREERRLIDSLAEMVASTLDKRAADAAVREGEQRLRAARDRARLLLEITTAVVSELDLRRLLEVVSQLLAEKIPHHFASIALWEEDTQQLRRHALVFSSAHTNLVEAGRLVSIGSPADITYRRGTTTVFSWNDVLALGEPTVSVMAAEQLRTVCCVPLKTARGAYGVLNIGKSDDEVFTADEVALLESIAQQLAIAFENALSFRTAERYRQDSLEQRDRLRLLLDINNQLLAQHESHATRLSVLAMAKQFVSHDYAALVIYDAELNELRVEACTYHDQRGVMEPKLVLPQGRSPSGLAFFEQRTRMYTASALEQFDAEAVAGLRADGIRSVCSVPLVTQRGPLGTLTIGRRSPDGFTEKEVSLLGDVAAQVSIAVANTLAYQEISALKDRLTEEKLYLEDEISSQRDFKQIVGTSQALTSVLRQIRTVAPTDATVLLLGETGTGKELLARALHDASRRRALTFVRVNGAALPGSLIESELFGYEKGAFTGATTSKVGRFELAHRGTLFLDEVGEIPLDVQPKLLRALQEQEFERLGSTRTQKVDVRLIAATNRDLNAMVAGGTFRSDLYYRLSVFPIFVPPLRDRPEDIAPLVHHFVHKFSREIGRGITTIPASTMDALQKWPWPGNIRELENVIERAVILSPGGTLQVPASAFQGNVPRVAVAGGAPVAAESAYHEGEREMILKALRETKGVIAGPDGAAARLGLKRTTLHSKMRKLGIERPSF